MIQTLRHKKAFSMIEVVFVIVVLGIVASIGSQIIVQVYESYIAQRAVHRSNIKTELAITQLVNRLAYSIPRTVIARNGANFLPIESIPPGDTLHTILEWIGYDDDGFSAVDTATGTGAGRRPAWSGYADLLASSKDSLSTPGSRLDALNTIINNLSKNVSGTANSGIANSAILFPDTYDAYTVGYAGGISAENIHPVLSGTDTTLTLDPVVGGGSRTIREHYKLAWTAYAVVPVALTEAEVHDRGFDDIDTGDGLWDLRLYYDYQPWEGESYTNGKSQILIRNVSVFNFTGSGSSIRLKICQRENIGGMTINSCKEKAVIR
ncbi:MAG: prepilin-type N-terminal cleavage/methylation domain-containing protein [Sulfurovum sp.]|nr:prepilin-type N-terminal cleavage/methylation domain-containing protein [Sulfurovum sp.]